jgi:hypothetical protein
VAIVTRWATPTTAAQIGRLPKLALIANFGVPQAYPPAQRFVLSFFGHNAAKAVVPPNLANLPKQTFRIMVSADLDNLGGHPSHDCHHTPRPVC